MTTPEQPGSSPPGSEERLPPGGLPASQDEVAPQSEEPGGSSPEPEPNGGSSEPTGGGSADARYREIVEQLAATQGVVLLIGATDTGKTTLCRAVADAVLAAGRRIAVVDADSGQSEIGPPTTLGLGLPEAAFTRLSDLKPRALAFVGSTSPPGYLLEWALGTRFLADRAGDLGAQVVLVDTPGLVSGPVGLRLQQAIAEAIQPAAYVLLERKRELRTLQRGLPPGHIHRPGVLPAVRKKTPTVRSLRRTAKFAQYFEDAREWELPVDEGIIRGGLLFLGRPLRPPALESLQEQVPARLLHVEQDEDGVRVITAGNPSREAKAALSQRFGRRVVVLEAGRLKYLVVGLLDLDGETVAIGSVQRVDFRRRRLRIATPWLDPDAIGGFIWGTARVTPEGKELEALRRGEI